MSVPVRRLLGRRRWTIRAAAIFPLILVTLLAAAVAQSPAAADPRFTVVAGSQDVAPGYLTEVERLLPAAIERAASPFPGAPFRPFRVVVHDSVASLHPDLREHLHPQTPGLALLGRDEIHIVLDEVQRRPPNDLATVLTHEVVHVLLDQQAGAFARFVPRWLHEGLAQYLSGDTYLGVRETDLALPAASGRLLRFADLESGFPSQPELRARAYAQSFSFVSYLARTVGIDDLVAAIPQSRGRFGYAGGFARQTHTPLTAHIDEWTAWLRNESGASWRFLFANCFAYLMIVGFVLLALAVRARLRRDDTARRKLARDELREAADEVEGPDR